MPEAVLPAEVDKHLRSLGGDGEAVRRVLERDFLAYSKTARINRQRLRTILIVSVAQPLLLRASKAAATALFAPQEEEFAERLARIRARVMRGTDAAPGGMEAGSTDQAPEAGDAAPAQPGSPPGS